MFMSKKIKNIIIVVVILAIVLVAYFLFFGKSKTPIPAKNTGSLTTSSGAPVTSVVNPNPTPANTVEASKISQEFVNQLLNLKAIKLNDDIFSSLAFQSLEDFTITLVQPGNEGRNNPFAPFGADATVPADATPGISNGTINVTPINDLPPTSTGSNNSLPGSPQS